MAIWDQQTGESNTAYARFLVYRNLGPLRTLPSAHDVNDPLGKGKKRQEAGAAWNRDSARWSWVERASAWDVHILVKQGNRFATLFMHALDKMAESVGHALAGGVKPDNARDLAAWVNAIGPYLTPELTDHIRKLSNGEFVVPGSCAGDEAEKPPSTGDGETAGSADPGGESGTGAETAGPESVPQ